MFKALFVISLLAYFLYMMFRLKKELHIIQLNSYMNDRYWGWHRKNRVRVLQLKDFFPILAVLPLLSGHLLMACLFWIFAYYYLFLTRVKEKEKKKLVFTSRATRLFSVVLLILLALFSATLYGFLLVESVPTVAVIFFSMTIVSAFPFFLMLAGNVMIQPVENAVNLWYINDARKCMSQMPGLTVIGITGSFGKTSVKFMVSRILSEKYNVLMTPDSYNTTMGVVKVIRTMLKPVHEVFVVEMGAKQRGDIKELCDLVSPRMGILTALGEQHLETFKDMETIRQTKNELIEALPEDGAVFLNMDNEHVQELARSAKTRKVHYGVESNELDYSASDIKITPERSFFTVLDKNGTKEGFQTRLLGRQNICNIMGAVSVARELGIELRIIAAAVKNLEPVPHRLELKRTSKDLTIIDDAFNSNPVGSHAALDVLKEMPGNKKILITPGMVELGNREFELNKAFGVHASEVCDYIILVGPGKTVPIQEGLKEKQFPQEKYYVARCLDDANRQLQKIAEPNDIVLYENDLPDTYNE